MSKQYWQRRAILLIGLALLVGSRAAIADEVNYCDATYMTPAQFLSQLQEVNVVLNVAQWVTKIVPADDLRSQMADLLGKYNITVREGAPVTLMLTLDHVPGAIDDTTTYTNGTTSKETYHTHLLYFEMTFFVRGVALRGDKFHAVMASPTYINMTFTVEEGNETRRFFFGDEVPQDFKEQLKLNLPTPLQAIADNHTVDPTPWPADSWSEQQKAKMNAAYAAFVKSNPKVEKVPTQGWKTAQTLDLSSDINADGFAEDPSWNKMWRATCDELGWNQPIDQPLLTVEHYFFVGHAQKKNAYAWPDYYRIFDRINVKEANVVFDLNGRLERKPMGLFAFHRSMLAVDEDLKGIFQGYIPRSLQECEIDLKNGAQPLPPSEESSETPNSGVALGMNFVRLQPGMFVMGSPDGEVSRGSNETQHAVKLTKAFYIATKDVTHGQFAAFVADANYKTEAEKAGDENTWRHNTVFEETDDCPVVDVSWNDAQAFIAWLGKRDHKIYRLPTEAEWEYACRAGTTTTFSTGDTISADQANYDGRAVYGAGVTGECRWKTMPVGSFPANPWGLYDMQGNVWQWCADVFGDYPNDTVTDPKGGKPDAKAGHVLRGGSWGIDPMFLRSAARLDGGAGSHGGYNVGFRLVTDSE